MRYRTLQPQKSTLFLKIRSATNHQIIAQASNDTQVDSFNTIITAESLMADWWQGFQEHRTLSQQHNYEDLRGIPGLPQVGVVTRVDFAPHLIVEATITDPNTWALVEAGKLTGVSLEFKPEQSTPRSDGQIVYTRLSQEPEFCGISIVDIPSVPFADIIGTRAQGGQEPNWIFAVVDPRVTNGEITDPAQIRALQWFPHHDITDPARATEPNAVRAALETGIADLTQADIPQFASLTLAEVRARAIAHMQRHASGLMSRAESEQKKRDSMKFKNKKDLLTWLTSQSEADALVNDVSVLAARAAIIASMNVENRAMLEAPDEAEILAPGVAAPATQNVNLNIRVMATRTDEEVQAEAEADAEAEAKAAAEKAEAERVAAEKAAADAAAKAELENRARANVETPLGHIAGVGNSNHGQNLDEVLTEVMMRTIMPHVWDRLPTATEMQEVENILQQNGIAMRAMENGIERRALTLGSSGITIFKSLARYFTEAPTREAVARNHFTNTVDMQGIKEAEFPVFDGSTITTTWNCNDEDNCPDSDPTEKKYKVVTCSAITAVTISDDYEEYNPASRNYVQRHLLPAMKRALELAEDKAIFAANGLIGEPNFKGLLHETDRTVAAAANGLFDPTHTFEGMLAALPDVYAEAADLAFFVPRWMASAYRTWKMKLVGNSASDFSNIGIQGATNTTRPVGDYAGIPIYSVLPLSGLNQAILIPRSNVVLANNNQVKLKIIDKNCNRRRLEMSTRSGKGVIAPAADVVADNVTAVPA